MTPDLLLILIQMNQMYANNLSKRDLQPYEALFYQQACRTAQTWLSAIDQQIQREKDELDTTADDLEG